MSHSLEPWHTDFVQGQWRIYKANTVSDWGLTGINCHRQFNGSGAQAGPDVLVSSEQAEANARRLVACVNACAGIPTELLEAGGFVKLDDDPLYELVPTKEPE